MTLEEAVLSKTRTTIATTGQAKDCVLDNMQLGWLLTAPSLAPRTSKVMPIASNGLAKGSANKVLTCPG